MTPAEVLAKLNEPKAPFTRFYAFEDTELNLDEIEDALIGERRGATQRRIVVHDKIAGTYYALNYTQHHEDGIDSTGAWVEVKRVEVKTYVYVPVDATKPA